MKLNKKQLMERAGLGEDNNHGLTLQENVAADGDIEMDIIFDKGVKWFLEAAKAIGAEVIMDPNDSFQTKALAETIKEDLETWLGNNGAQWLEDGIDQGVYDEFITK